MREPMQSDLRLQIANDSMFLNNIDGHSLNSLKLDNMSAVTPNKFELGIKAISNFFKSRAYTKQFGKADSSFKLSRIKLTRNINEIRELLSPDMVQIFIMSGIDSVRHILFPFLAQFFNSKEVSEQEKIDKIKQLKLDYKECERYLAEEFLEDKKKISEVGVSYFSAHVNSVIKPYSL